MDQSHDVFEQKATLTGVERASLFTVQPLRHLKELLTELMAIAVRIHWHA